jgi:hypothetical protein
MPSEYVEPDLGPDLLEDMEIIFKRFGKSLRKKINELPPCDKDDIIEFDVDLHQEELDKNLHWKTCPEEHKAEVLEIIKEYWDVFCTEGLRRHIRGFTFRIDTGDVKPISCRQPCYGPHESRVMEEMVDALECNGLVQDDDGPVGSTDCSRDQGTACIRKCPMASIPMVTVRVLSQAQPSHTAIHLPHPQM